MYAVSPLEPSLQVEYDREVLHNLDIFFCIFFFFHTNQTTSFSNYHRRSHRRPHYPSEIPDIHKIFPNGKWSARHYPFMPQLAQSLQFRITSTKILPQRLCSHRSTISCCPGHLPPQHKVPSTPPGPCARSKNQGRGKDLLWNLLARICSREAF